MTVINNYEELENTIKSGKCLLKISTSSCGPCKVVKGIIENMESDYPDVRFIEVDADDCDDAIIDKFSVRGVPVIILLNDGNEINRSVGLQTAEQLNTRLNSL